MEFLALSEIQDRKHEVREELDQLLLNRALVARPQAKQWRFFNACVERVLIPEKASAFDSLPRTNAAQLKFEVEDKLRTFYQRGVQPVKLVFMILHKRELERFRIPADGYPLLVDYALMIRDVSSEVHAPHSLSELRAYLERVVTEAVDAEFAAYSALPEIQTDGMRKWFWQDGPAYKEILNILSRHKGRGWVISNHLNPSTKQLLRVKVRSFTVQEAEVATTEYWLLRWWGTHQKKYIFPYRETNRQLYILVARSGVWKVWKNPRPPSRTSVSFRRIRRD